MVFQLLRCYISGVAVFFEDFFMPTTDEHAASLLTYAASGVNIEAGNDLVRRIKPHAARTRTAGVLGAIGGFGGLFSGDFSPLKEPVLVSGADGVGTKLMVAFAINRHDTVGRDLVAMNVNDVLCCGARPLFFLDYLGIGALAPDVGEAIIKGVADGCQEAGCALVGGETAELPGLYAPGEYDLAGFCVGVVDKAKIIDGARIKAGDALLGLPSTGLHSNGYSLARKILEPLGYNSFRDELGETIGEAMLRPTAIYVKPVLGLLEKVPVAGIVHITGGGFLENIPRVLPAHTRAVIHRDSWPVPPLFPLLHQTALQQGRIEERELFTTWNMGIGMVLIVAAEHEAAAISALHEYSCKAYRIGEIEACEGQSGEGEARVVLA
jgi:phosphoribosylformylglycinamidine cyclo-ligase